MEQITIDGRLYDVSDFVSGHPGGPIILKYLGRDASGKKYYYN